MNCSNRYRVNPDKPVSMGTRGGGFVVFTDGRNYKGRRLVITADSVGLGRDSSSVTMKMIEKSRVEKIIHKEFNGKKTAAFIVGGVGGIVGAIGLLFWDMMNIK